MRKWLIGIVVLILIVIVVAWRMPANMVLQTAQDRLPAVDWSKVDGTAWNGSVEDFSYEDIELGTLEWEFDELEDLGSQLTAWKVRSYGPQHEMSARVTLTPEGEVVRAEDIQGQVPASWVDISKWLPLLHLEGTIELDLEHIELDRNLPVSGAGRVTWSQAAISGGANERFGKLRLNLTPKTAGQPEGMAFTLHSMESADIRLRGEGHILRNDYDMDLKVEIALERDDLLRFMQPLGGEVGPGLYQFAWQGQIR